jgi:hypothetical protein
VLVLSVGESRRQAKRCFELETALTSRACDPPLIRGPGLSAVRVNRPWNYQREVSDSNDVGITH